MDAGGSHEHNHFLVELADSVKSACRAVLRHLFGVVEVTRRGVFDSAACTLGNSPLPLYLEKARLDHLNWRQR